MKKNASKILHPGQGKLKSLFNFVSFVFTKPGITLIRRVTKKSLSKQKQPAYSSWIKGKLDAQTLKKEYDSKYHLFANKPRISVIIAIAGKEATHIRSVINSIRAQLYQDWELLIINNGAGLPEEFIQQEQRIGIITAETGEAATGYTMGLARATGDYILFLEGSALLTPHCLFEFVKHINAAPGNTIIYADEDMIDDSGHHITPYFKPDWSPDSFLARNYIGNAFIIAAQFVTQLKFREDFDGNELFDLLLRATEQNSNIGHVPEVLFHQRPTTANPLSAKKALADAMIRRGTPAVIEPLAGLRCAFNIKYEIKASEKVSIIIPTKDHVALLKTALDSILTKTTYPDYEIIILNNNSSTKEFFALIAEYSNKYAGKLRSIDANFPFNFSKLMNIGVAASNGAYVLLLNNDIEVINGDWITQMVAYAQLSHIGAVGVKLLYPDNTIQHAGIVLGINGDAGHVFANMPKDSTGYHGCVKTATNYSAVTGACLMCRKELYLNAGGMDEALEVEYNDFDLCLQFLKMGHYNTYIPTELCHHESATRGHPFRSKSSWKQHEKNLSTFKKKWQFYIDNDPFYNPNLTITQTDFRIRDKE